MSANNKNEIIKRIEYCSSIYLFDAENYTAYLSDFIFIDDDNKKYLMYIRSKEFSTKWFVFKDSITDILYATDNVSHKSHKYHNKLNTLNLKINL